MEGLGQSRLGQAIEQHLRLRVPSDISLAMKPNAHATRRDQAYEYDAANAENDRLASEFAHTFFYCSSFGEKHHHVVGTPSMHCDPPGESGRAMSAFLYPGDLVNICKNEWERAQKQLTRTVKESEAIFSKKLVQDRPPFPSDRHLLELLQTVYHLSFLVEEGRRVAVRVIYLLPHTFERSGHLNLGQKPARLQQPVPFSVGELLKFAPAVQATESAIGSPQPKPSRLGPRTGS